MKVLTLTLLLSVLRASWDCEVIYNYDNSKEVFIGTVIKLELDQPYTIATLAVQNIYKKDNSHPLDTLSKVEIQSYFEIAKGYHWELGETYMVFVESIQNDLRIVNVCSATSKIRYKYDRSGLYVGIPSLEDVRNWWHKEEYKWKEE